MEEIFQIRVNTGKCSINSNLILNRSSFYSALSKKCVTVFIRFPPEFRELKDERISILLTVRNFLKCLEKSYLDLTSVFLYSLILVRESEKKY